MINQNTAFCEDLNLISPQSIDGSNFSHLCITIADRPEQIADHWKTLENSANDPFSSYTWAKAWYDAHENTPNCSPVIIAGTDKDHRPHFLLPLFQQKIGPFNILLRPGRTHSAYFSGLFSPHCRQMINSENAGQFWKSIFSAISGVDAIAIDGLRDVEIEQNNPLRFLPRMNSSNPSYEVSLSRDWETFYRSKTSRKARSNVRRCEKRLLELGSLRIETGENGKNNLTLLHALLAQKADQFRVRKIINPYEKENISSFYEKLVQCNQSDLHQSLEIRALYLEDTPLAVNLGIVQNNEFHGLIMSMVDGPLARFSPGRILLLRTMQHMSETGIEKIDFGVGQANYKEGLVDKAVIRHHVLAPLNLKGRVFVFGLRRAAAIKAFIKSSDIMKEFTKRVRWNSRKD